MKVKAHVERTGDGTDLRTKRRDGFRALATSGRLDRREYRMVLLTNMRA